LKRKQREKGKENNASGSGIGSNINEFKKYVEMRVNLIFMAKVEVMDQVVVNLLEKMSVI